MALAIFLSLWARGAGVVEVSGPATDGRGPPASAARIDVARLRAGATFGYLWRHSLGTSYQVGPPFVEGGQPSIFTRIAAARKHTFKARCRANPGCVPAAQPAFACP